MGKTPNPNSKTIYTAKPGTLWYKDSNGKWLSMGYVTSAQYEYTTHGNYAYIGSYGIGYSKLTQPTISWKTQFDYAPYTGFSYHKTADYVLEHSGLKQKVTCPACIEGPSADLKTMIIHINDIHKWKREQIADWLDTLDEQPIFYPDINFEAEGAESA